MNRKSIYFIYLYIFILMLCAGFAHARVDAQGTETSIARDEWVYQSLAQLNQNGLLINYPADWVAAGNRLSRFEVAYYIKQLLEKNSANGEWKSGLSSFSLLGLQRLIIEFRSELSDLGIRTTDIEGVTPSLTNSGNKSNEYQDLDQILSVGKTSSQEPFYYFGQYYKDFERKSFLFVPLAYVKPGDLSLLENKADGVNIVYQPQLEKMQSFLVVKGTLPVSGDKPVNGFYLFPIENDQPAQEKPALVVNSLDASVLNLLDEVSQLQQVEYLWQMKGNLPLDGYMHRESPLQSSLFSGNLNQGLKVGGLLIYTENSSRNLDKELYGLGQAFANQNNPMATTKAVDLDMISDKSLQSLQINYQGVVPLSPQTSLYGGVDFVFRENGTGLGSLWPTETKASAGLFYRINEEWTLLTYQSLVNSRLKNNGLLSTTSIGLSYSDWMTLWLAYQFLNYDDSMISGSVKLKF